MHKKSRIYTATITLLCAVFILVSPNTLAAMGPSPWAAPQIEQAISLGLVPDVLQSDYQSPITREDFCRLLYHVLFGQETEITLEQDNPFTDVDDPQIRYLAQRGIVSGHGNGIFAPQDGLTRQQAAVFLTNAARDFGRDLARDMSFMFQSPMSDREGFAAWAADSIAWVRRASIMTGTTADKFDPQGRYTREQAIITMLRFYDVVIGQKDYRNFQSYVVSLVPLTIENDVFSMSIPANVPYYRNIEQETLKYCHWVQEASGLSFLPKGKRYSKMTIVNSGDGAPLGSEDGIEIQDAQYIFGDYEYPAFYYLHELSHTLQWRAAYIDCRPFQEAFAILNSAKVAKKQGMDFLYRHLMSFNYAFIEPETERAIISSDFETYYRTSKSDWDVYLVGFRFGVYLEQRYGDDIFTKIIRRYAAKVGTRKTSRGQFVDFLKKQTGQNVFQDFVDWYWENKPIFAEKDELEQQAGMVTCLPQINKHFKDYTQYWNIKFQNSVTIDFRDSHALAQMHGYTVNGITAFMGADRLITVTAFDKDGKQVDKIMMPPGERRRVMFKNAVTLVVTGTNGHLFFNPDFETNYSK